MTCYVSLLHSQVKGESHALVCGSRSHALIPTGARSRPAALPKPIIISVPRPHCWKGSASKPYVELPPHTAPLGMEVGPAQACAVKVVVHDPKNEKKVVFDIKKEGCNNKNGHVQIRKRKILTHHFLLFHSLIKYYNKRMAFSLRVLESRLRLDLSISPIFFKIALNRSGEASPRSRRSNVFFSPPGEWEAPTFEELFRALL